MNLKNKTIFVFFDFEILQNGEWLCGFLSSEKNYLPIWNDKKQLFKILQDERIFFVGFNNLHYDNYIINCLYNDIPPKKFNDFLFDKNQKNKAFEFPDLKFKNKFQFKNIDLYNFLQTGFLANKGLKNFEAKSGLELFEFDFQNEVNDKKIITNYNKNDLVATAKIFEINKEIVDAHIWLCENYLDDSFLPKTATDKAINIICKNKLATTPKQTKYPKTFPIKFGVYQKIFDKHFADKILKHDEKINIIIPPNFETDCKIVLGVGGIHGAPEEIIEKKGVILTIDITSFYPNLLTNDKFKVLQPENFDILKLKEIIKIRTIAKNEKDFVRSEALKLVINSLTGSLKAQYKKSFNPIYNLLMCLTGQFLMLDLIDKLYHFCEILNVNTDGVIIKIDVENNNLKVLDTTLNLWQKRTGFNLEVKKFERLIQRDVNNYILVDDEKNLVIKGSLKNYQTLTPKNTYPPTITNAVIKNLVLNEEICQNINENSFPNFTDYKFRKNENGLGNWLLVSTKGVYDYLLVGDDEKFKTVRAIATKNGRTIFKSKNKTQLHKIANFPEKIKLIHENTKNVDLEKLRRNVDYDYYKNYCLEILKTWGRKNESEWHQIKKTSAKKKF